MVRGRSPRTFETPRLWLRELTETDAPALLALYRRPEIIRFMGPPPASLGAEIENIRAHQTQYYAARGYGLWGVILRETDELIGRCGLLDAMIDGQVEVELSYLLDPASHGHGFATEAARSVLAFAAATLGLERVVAAIQPTNAASRRVAERLDMRYDRSVPYKHFGIVDLFAWRHPGSQNPAYSPNASCWS